MTSAPSIHFHGGIGTIGGTKIFVQEGDYRVLFDFGLTYAPGGDFWGGRIHARDGAAALRDYITLGYVPALDGIYRPADAATAGVKPGWDGKTHVFISHLHLDHMAVLDLLADDVPVWMHGDSLRLLAATAETGEQPHVPAGARAFTWGEPIQVGPIKVTPVAVDHDIPGASALLIETSAGTVVYTGDLRMHGANPERIQAFIETARAANPKILLIEGTRLGEPERAPDLPPALTEPEVPGRIVEYLKDRQGMAFVTMYPRNTLRMQNVAKAVGDVGRTLVLSPEAAHIYAAMGGDLGGVAVYQRDKDKLALSEGTAVPWLVKLFQSGVTVLDAAAVRQAPAKYLVQLFYWDINELVDLKPGKGAVFIHSNGEPLGRFDPAFDLWVQWLNFFGVELLFAACTGHATHQALAEIVAGINPALLMPIHSREPQLLEVTGINRTLPELGAIYEVGTGKRIG